MWMVLLTKLFLRRDNVKKAGNMATARSDVDTVDNRFALFGRGDYEPLIRWMLLATKAAPRLNTRKVLAEDAQLQKGLHMLSKGQLSRAVRYILSDGAADLSSPCIARLYKHKQVVPRVRPISAGLPRQLRGISNSVLLREVYRKLNAEAASGPSGSHNAHLKVLAHSSSDALGKTAVLMHEKVASLHLSALLPGWYYRLTGSAVGVALWKKPALPHLPKGIRPLGLGDVAQRAWESGFVADETAAVRTTFWEAGQVSTGVAAGCEKVAFGHRAHMEFHQAHAVGQVDIMDVHVTLTPDSANAFPTISRAQTIAEAAARPRFRKMALLFAAIYKQETDVVNVRGAKISEGMKQGQACGTFAHNTCTLPHCERANDALRRVGGFANFVTDDGVFSGPLRHVLAVWDRYRRDVKTYCNSDTNLDKSVITGPPGRMIEIRQVLDANDDWRHVRFDTVVVGGRTHYGVELGGVPIGEDEYVRAALERKLAASTSNFNKIIMKLSDVCPQAAYAIVTKHFLAEWVYTLRTVYPSLTVPFARRMDEIIARGVAEMTHVPLPAGSIAEGRAAQPLKTGGGAMRKLADLAAPAFLGAICQCVPSFDDQPTADGQVERGLLRHMSWFYGPGSFVEANHGQRFAVLLANGSRLAQEMRGAWDTINQDVPVSWRLDPNKTDNMLATPIEALGTIGGIIVPKVQRKLTHERESILCEATVCRVTAAIGNRVAFDETIAAWTTGADLSPAGVEAEQAIAARCADGFSGEFLQALPARGKRIRPEQWRIMYARRFGLECSECSPHRHVVCGTTQAGFPVKIGRYGRGLTLGSRACTKGFQTKRHDCGVRECFQAMQRAGVLARLEPKDKWRHLVANRTAWEQAAPKVRAASIPDLEEECVGGGTKLLDGKFWSACPTWFRHCWFMQQGQTVAGQRQHAGSQEMMSRLRAADRIWNHGVPRNARGQGPIEAAARAYGRIEIVGCGPYGEVTPDTAALVKRIAASAAASGWRPMGARSAAEAAGVMLARVRQQIGVAFARATADLTLRRLRYELQRCRAPQSSGTARRDAAAREGAAASDAYDARSRKASR
jgi:hypothetical protein